MRYFKLLLIVVATGMLSGCSKTLDVGPLDIIGSDVVWKDESLVNAYFSGLYNDANLIFGLDETNSSNFLGQYHGSSQFGSEGTNRQVGQMTYTDGRLAGDQTGIPLARWSYGYIRNVNTAIDNLIGNENLSESYVKKKLGEAYFFRAHVYFEMAKRYGGLPIVDKVLDVTAGSTPELNVQRSTEAETYDFILQDLNTAYGYLKEGSSTISEVSKWSVLALKSRAMLYAGSIAANNSKLPLKGDNNLVGIEASLAKKYYTESLNASKEIIEQGPFQLKKDEADLTANFRNLFITDNKEIIMKMDFTGLGGRYNDLEILTHPRVKAYETWGNMISPYLENVEAFEYRDGTPGNMLYGTSSTLRESFKVGKFYSLDQLFGKKDYRMRATICIPQTQYIGEPIYYHLSVTNAAYANSVGVPLKCQNQNTGPNRGHTGFGQLKYLMGKPFLLGEGSNDVPVYRLGEIYLNFAEAALGSNQEMGQGLILLNKIRERAGLLPRATLTFDGIVQERRVELMFEHHRYWDLRRWRMAQSELSKNNNGVDWVWNVEQQTYQLTMKQNVEHYNRLFKPQHYYFPLPQSVIRDDKLIQNPGYEF